VIRGQWISVCGPDYESESEFRVVDIDSGAVAFVFTETGDWPFMCGATYAGTASVALNEEGTHVVVTDHDGKVLTQLLPA
jgi:hypothetical protein